MIEDEFVGQNRKSWGVLQRNHMGIWVLQATNMPAVLIETGFITNKEEEDYLNSEAGQQENCKINSKRGCQIQTNDRWKTAITYQHENIQRNKSRNTHRHIHHAADTGF